MNKQVVIIGGGSAFWDEAEYLNHLATKPISLDHFRKETNWKNRIKDDLGEGYDVIIPPMPCKENARYVDWKIFFDRFVGLLNEEVILVGHSMGGAFLMIYLSQNRFPKKIKATILLATPFIPKQRHPFADFTINPSLPGVREQAGRMFIFHSMDDAIVPVASAHKFLELFPDSTLTIFDDNRAHLNEPTFPELVAAIRSV